MRHLYNHSGSVDDFVATLRSLDGTTLASQAVAFSFNNGATWLTASWQGVSGTTRKAKVTLTAGTNMPAVGRYPNVLARIGTTAFRIGSAQVH